MPLTEHTGMLGEKKAAHLLRRCTFNVTPQRIRTFATLTAEQAVEHLFNFNENSLGPNGLPPNKGLLFPNGPLWHKDGAPMHPPGYGASKVNYVGGRNYCHSSFYQIVDNFGNHHINCDNYLTATYLQSGVFSWQMYEAINDTSIRWKLVFWMNTLFTTSIKRQHYHYPHWKLMYDFVNGIDVTNGFTSDGYNYANSLKALAFIMTYSNQMLLYLDNNVNTKKGPNENYAREFLELFTILKDPNSNTEGDYVNYTEQDVVEAAKVLTGFTDDKLNFDTVANRPWGTKNFANHWVKDPNEPSITKKIFSSAFGRKEIESATSAADMDRELWEFIDMVFDQDDPTGSTNPNIKPTAHSFVRKMYRYFVSDKIDNNVETNVITVLANDLYAINETQNVNFLYQQVLKNLLKSEHFYEDGTSKGYSPCNSLIGSKIKSPLELLLTSINLLEIRNKDLDNLVNIYKEIVNSLDEKGFINEVRKPKVVYVNFNANPISIDGSYVNDGSSSLPNNDYTSIYFAELGIDHKDLVTEGYLTIANLKKVFHNCMFTQFGVPLQLCGFNLEGPNTVEGYIGCYKEENYSKNWLDNNNFYNRYSFGRSLLDGYTRFKGFNKQYEDVAIQYKVDLIEWVKKNIVEIGADIYSPDVVVETMLKYLLPEPLLPDSERYAYFFGVFMREIPDMDWTIAWHEFILDETDMLKRTEVETPLYNLCRAITESHEFQTF